MGNNNNNNNNKNERFDTPHHYVATKKAKIDLGNGYIIDVSPGDVWKSSDPRIGQSGKGVLVVPMGNKSKFFISLKILNAYFRKRESGSAELNKDRRENRGKNKQFTIGGRRSPEEIRLAKGKNMSQQPKQQQNEEIENEEIENEEIVNENLKGTDRYTTSGLKKTIETLKRSKNPNASKLIAKTQKLLDMKTAKAGNPVGTRKERYAADARRAAARPSQGSMSSNNKASDDENENRQREVTSGVNRSEDGDKKPKASKEPSIKQRAHAATKRMPVPAKAGKTAMKIGLNNSVETDEENQISETISETISAYDYTAAAIDGNVVNFSQNVKSELDDRVGYALEYAKEVMLGKNEEENNTNENEVNEESVLKNELLEAIANMNEEDFDVYLNSLDEEELQQFEKLFDDVYNEQEQENTEE